MVFVLIDTFRPLLIFNLPIFFRVGMLTPNGTITVDCGSKKTFDCAIPNKPIEWTTSGLSGVSEGPFLARNEAMTNSRIKSPDTGQTLQTGVSRITISGFSKSDNGGTIQCINKDDGSVWGMASISVGEWLCEICVS